MNTNAIVNPTGFFGTTILVIAVIWEIVWKAIALWKSARNGHKYWFIGFFLYFLFAHIWAIPEIIYLKFFQDKRGKKDSSDTNTTSNKKTRTSKKKKAT